VDDAQVFLTAGDFEVMTTHGGLLFKAPGDARAAMRAAVDRDAVIVSEPFANKHRKGIGDSVEIPTPAGRVRFRIEAVYFDYASDRGIIAMDRRTFAALRCAAPTGSRVPAAGADAEQVRRAACAHRRRAARVVTRTGLADGSDADSTDVCDHVGARGDCDRWRSAWPRRCSR
jgi:hypothetical protein